MALIKCSECGKSISDKAKACPKCGAPINKEFNTYALAGFILSLISMIINIVSFVALYMSAKGFDQIKITNEKGKGLAITGFIISAIYGITFIYKLLVYNNLI